MVVSIIFTHFGCDAILRSVAMLFFYVIYFSTLTSTDANYVFYSSMLFYNAFI